MALSTAAAERREQSEERREQMMAALHRANDIRLGRAQIKRELRAGTRSIADTLTDPSRYISTARVGEILCALPRFGEARSRKMMREAQVGLTRTCGDLVEREKKALILRLKEAGVR